ncbi:MAG: hypothetical protein JWQ98_845 [Chlorobi bacterium]|nr:hypothetical protein [Chlorobiota bacterium]
MTNVQALPILEFTPNDGEQALLDHQLSEREREIFREMDRETLALPDEAELEEHHAVVIPIGARYGLDAEQSVVFWVRSTFMLFES